MISEMPIDQLEAIHFKRATGRGVGPEHGSRLGETRAPVIGQRQARLSHNAEQAGDNSSDRYGGVSRPRRVAILVESSNAYGRGLLLGVHDHLAGYQAPRWMTFLPEHGRGAPPLKALATWHVDGVIARVENDQIARAVEELQVPTVDVSAARLLSGYPFVETDDALIARLAASHFQELRFRNVAFVGDPRFSWSANRERHFAEEAAARGMVVDVFVPARRAKSTVLEYGESLAHWLRSLQKPVAVFACQDCMGTQVLEACRWENIRVPDEVAVLGVDNDEVLCSLSSPPLSSIVPDARGAGRLAGELLDGVILGEAVPLENLLPPLRVAVRQSTDIVAVDDPLVAEAARFIHQNAHRGLKVGDVVAAMAVSRRSLTQRFIQQLNRSPHDEILRVQLQIVERLLRESGLKMVAIARKSGFKHPEYMAAVFQKQYGTSPSEWRRKNRPGDGGQMA